MLVQNHFPFIVHPFLTAEKYGFPPVKNAVIAPPVLVGKERFLKRFLVVFTSVSNSFFNIKHPPHENFLNHPLRCTLYHDSFSNSSRIQIGL